VFRGTALGDGLTPVVPGARGEAAGDGNAQSLRATCDRVGARAGIDVREARASTGTNASPPESTATQSRIDGQETAFSGGAISISGDPISISGGAIVQLPATVGAAERGTSIDLRRRRPRRTRRAIPAPPSSARRSTDCPQGGGGPA
jgi:hypothetical protein